MGNRLPVFEGFLLPIAEVTLHFMGKRMVPFLALCGRGWDCLEGIFNNDYKIS